MPQAPSSGVAARPASSVRRPIRGAWSLTRRMMTPAPGPRRPVRRIVTGVRVPPRPAPRVTLVAL
ncbi:hypothetical protein DMP15_21155 [Pseudonocardia sp. UM4_GMWB1]